MKIAHLKSEIETFQTANANIWGAIFKIYTNPALVLHPQLLRRYSAGSPSLLIDLGSISFQWRLLVDVGGNAAVNGESVDPRGSQSHVEIQR